MESISMQIESRQMALAYRDGGDGLQWFAQGRLSSRSALS